MVTDKKLKQTHAASLKLFVEALEELIGSISVEERKRLQTSLSQKSDVPLDETPVLED